MKIGNREYWSTFGQVYPATIQCEHCDGVDSHFVRIDNLRGHVCPPCDLVLDEMFAEPPGIEVLDTGGVGCGVAAAFASSIASAIASARSTPRMPVGYHLIRRIDDDEDGS